MARRQSWESFEPTLYDYQQRAEIRRARRQRALFIPRYLTEAAKSYLLAGSDQERAHAIAVRWADLEADGRLAAHTETSIDAQFLAELFGDGLAYATKTLSPEKWQLERNFAVPGVGTADAAIGEFPAAACPAAIIELKDARTDLDRDRSNGRTAAQQCWDYLNALPGCPWGIVSNFATIRLYHRDKGTLAYEEFGLQELRDPRRFAEFYCIFERGGLLKSRIGQRPRALDLLEQTQARQKTVGDELYQSYQSQRLRLIEHLMHDFAKPLDSAIRIAQKILDRVIFIAFCEDRELLRAECLARAWRELPAFTKATNPRWQNFLALFGEVDRGGRSAGVESGYNGNLFKHDDELDNLNLADDPWTDGFRNFGTFDFSEEVNVEVLGHLFERSVTELEKLRVGGLFALKAAIENGNGGHGGNGGNGNGGNGGNGGRRPSPNGGQAASGKMPKSAQRKRFGIYYTPPAFTNLIVDRTINVLVAERFAALAAQHGVDPESRDPGDGEKPRAYWAACFEALQQVTVCDPACGSGAFLIRAYDALDAHYKIVVHRLAGAGVPKSEVAALEDSIPDLILSRNLFGVDLSEQAVEITQLALWIRSARRDRKLSDLSRNVIWGNSLVADPAVDPRALNWAAVFPTIFGGRAGDDAARGFSCVIGNPPWERLKLQEREFFSLTDPDTAEAVNAAQRRRRIAAMQKTNPQLYADYERALASADRVLTHARQSGEYPLTGKGDINTYMLFAELAMRIVAADGLVGLLLPSGIATDETTKEFFRKLMDERLLISLYDFENKEAHFEDVHRSFKFSALVFGGGRRSTEQADFVFFARGVEEVAASNKQRHIPLTAADMKLLNPNTRTCPIFRTRRDAQLTRAVYKRVPILLDHQRRRGGNPWGVKFLRMFDQTNDAEHFVAAKDWEQQGYKLRGNVYVSGRKRALPLYEAKMVQAFDHRAASVVIEDENWVRQGQKEETSPVEHANPEFSVMPRWWVQADAVEAALPKSPGNLPWFLGFKDITSPTNERTMIAAFIPRAAVTNKFVLMLADIAPRRRRVCSPISMHSCSTTLRARRSGELR